MVHLLIVLVFSSLSVQADHLGKRTRSSHNTIKAKRPKYDTYAQLDKFMVNYQEGQKTGKSKSLSRARKFITNIFPDLSIAEMSLMEPESLAEIFQAIITLEKNNIKMHSQMACLYSSLVTFDKVGIIIRKLSDNYLHQLSWQMTEADFFSSYLTYKIKDKLCKKINSTDPNYKKYLNDKLEISGHIVRNYHNESLQKKLKIRPHFFARVKEEFNRIQIELQPAQIQEQANVVAEELPATPAVKQVHFPENVVTEPSLHRSSSGLLKSKSPLYFVGDYLTDDLAESQNQLDLFLRAVDACFQIDPQNIKFKAQIISSIGDFFAFNKDGGDLDKSVKQGGRLILAFGFYSDGLKIMPAHSSIINARKVLVEQHFSKNKMKDILMHQVSQEAVASPRELLEQRFEELRSRVLTKPELLTRTLSNIAAYLLDVIERKNLMDNQDNSARAKREFLKVWNSVETNINATKD